jgi:hypothetical protein
MSQYVVQATWDDVPHLSTEEKERMLSRIQPHLRLARSKGVPHLGAGSIYPIPEEEIIVKEFQFPVYWPRSYALDVGWNRTAALWQAWDQDADVVYLYSEYYRGQAEAPIHAEGIKARGEWIRGVVDPASRGRSQQDGTQLFDQYESLGLHLTTAINAISAGIDQVWTRLSTGRLKVFRSLENWLGEYRVYRRDEKGKIIEGQDHLMDCTRYVIMSGLTVATSVPIQQLRDQESKPYNPMTDW